ncbi:MAG: hypothetical protein N3A69_04130 [Leptospiraceae bacterium]|nr:hypothetical protein [Leptospiraceae bacterium]
MSLIETVAYSFTRDYRTKLLNSILVKNQNPKKFEHEGEYCFFQKTKSKIIELISSSKENDVLCIQSKTITDREILSEIERSIGNGVNVYIVLHEIDSEIRNRFKNKAQVRWEVNLCGSFLIRNQEKGILFQSSLETNKLITRLYYSLWLSEKQAEDLFQFFCHLFWNRADQSLLEDKVPESPYGEIGIPARIYLRENLKNLLDVQNGLISLRELGTEFFDENSTVSGSKLFLSGSGNDLNLLKTLGLKNTIYLGSSREPNLLQFILGEKEGFFLQNLEGELIYALLLSDKQLKEFQSIFQKKVESYEHQYFAEISYKDIKNEFRFYENDSSYKQIENSKHVPIKLSISLENLKKLKETPEEIFASLLQRAQQQRRELNEPLALEVTYHLEAKPVSIPEKAQKDNFQKDWESIQKKYQEKIQEVVQTSNQIEELKKSLTGRVFDALKGFFAGKEQKKNERQRELEELKQKDIMLDVTRKNYIQKLNEIIEAVNKDLQEVSEQVQLEQRKEKLENEKESLQKEIKDLQEKKAQKEKSLESLETQIANELLEKEKKLKEAEEKDKKKIEEEIQTYKNSKNLEKNKISDEVKSLNSQIEKLQVRFQNLKLEDIRFEEKQGSTLASLHGKKTSNTSSESKIEIAFFQVAFPNEEPPSVGVLYNHESKRYLAIQTWEEFEQAKKEAERLNATLCVRE